MFTLRHKAWVENKTTYALSHCIFVLTKMSTMVNDFEKLRTEYESCPDFCDIYAILRNERTREVDGYTLQDGYLVLGRKLCISRTSLKEFLLWELHAGGLTQHFGNKKTIETVKYRFISVVSSVMLHTCWKVSHLSTCQETKAEYQSVNSTVSTKLPLAGHYHGFCSPEDSNNTRFCSSDCGPFF